jgi:hypothetical protein
MPSKSTTTAPAASTDATEENANVTSTEGTPVSAYGFAKIVNRLIADNAAEYPGLKELPVQMFYSYKAKGLIGTEKKPLTAEYAAEWFVTYAAKKVERETTKVAKREAELKGDATEDEATDEA